MIIAQRNYFMPRFPVLFDIHALSCALVIIIFYGFVHNFLICETVINIS